MLGDVNSFTSLVTADDPLCLDGGTERLVFNSVLSSSMLSVLLELNLLL